MDSVRVSAGLLLVVAFGGDANAGEPMFEPAAGVFRFELPARSAADEPLTLPPLNGEPAGGSPNL